MIQLANVYSIFSKVLNHAYPVEKGWRFGVTFAEIAAWVESAAYSDFSKVRRHIRSLRKLTNLC